MGARLSRHASDGRCVPSAPIERFDLVAGAAELSIGRKAADERPNGMERRRDPTALSHAF